MSQRLDETVAGLLLAATENTPDRIAVVGQNDRLTFGSLWRAASAVASSVANATPQDRPVACLVAKTPIGMAGFIGCLMSGRTCIVLDPAYPDDRIAAILDDAKAATLLTDRAFPRTSVPCIALDDATTGETDPPLPGDPNRPLAVYYTSGSSGRPKGIACSTLGVLARAEQLARSWNVQASDVVMAPNIHTSLGGAGYLLGSLAVGARVVVADIARDGLGRTLALMEQEATTCLAVSPPMLRTLTGPARARTAFSHLRALRVGGSAYLRRDHDAVRHLVPPTCRIVHAYASTEASTIAEWPVDEALLADEPIVPAGRILDGVRTEILDGTNELVVSGPHIALGDWTGGDLVTDRFEPVPDRPGWRRYRTGDRVRMHPDGLLRIVGRVDRQIKINNTIVEPAEVEAVLRAHPAVAEAVVMVADGEPALLAFALSDTPALEAALHAWLAARLPSPACPRSIGVLPAFPRLPNGKADRMILKRMSDTAAKV